MKRLVTVFTLLAALSTPAFADGFRCEAIGENLDIKVFNHTNPEMGTRNAAVMVLTDPSVKKGRRTIAVFRDIYSTLSNKGAKYLAKVDLRFKESRRKGEYVAGTRLGNIATIEANLDFLYTDRLEDGDEVEGFGEIVLRNGDSIELDLVCTRYLKN